MYCFRFSKQMMFTLVIFLFLELAFSKSFLESRSHKLKKEFQIIRNDFGLELTSIGNEINEEKIKETLKSQKALNYVTIKLKGIYKVDLIKNIFNLFKARPEFEMINLYDVYDDELIYSITSALSTNNKKYCISLHYLNNGIVDEKKASVVITHLANLKENLLEINLIINNHNRKIFDFIKLPTEFKILNENEKGTTIFAKYENKSKK